jgi:transposase-like protein
MENFEKTLSGWPIVLVTDKKNALINAIKHVFPKTANFFFRWHLNKNIIAKCKTKFKDNESFVEFQQTISDICKC